MAESMTQCERCGLYKKCQEGSLKVRIDASYGRCLDYIPRSKTGHRRPDVTTEVFSLSGNREIEPSFKYGRTCAICRYVSQAARKQSNIARCSKHQFLTKDQFVCDAFEIITREIYEQQMQTIEDSEND